MIDAIGEQKIRFFFELQHDFMRTLGNGSGHTRHLCDMNAIRFICDAFDNLAQKNDVPVLRYPRAAAGKRCNARSRSINARLRRTPQR